MGFADSFCDPQNLFLPPPIPPPRSKKHLKVNPSNQEKGNSPKATETNLMGDPLIQLESLDEVSLFDPLKETNIKDSDVFSFLAPKAVSNSKVAELKNTIQNLTSSSNPRPTFYSNSMFYSPQVAQPGLVLPRYPIPGMPSSLANVSQVNGIPLLDASKPPVPPKETKPALPPKTRPPSSRFFVSTSELTDVDKELLNDYGLSNSPIFQSTFTDGLEQQGSNDEASASTEKILNTLNPFSTDCVNNKLSPETSTKDTKVQSSWQKFT